MLYPIGMQSFEDLRRKGFVYVDKTRQVFNLAVNGKYYFLSRPRRFGKSLLVSTMEAYFKGKKELFKGLAIGELEKDWNEYPVLHLDFSGKAYNAPDVLDKVLDDALCKWEEMYGSVNRSDVPGIRFGNVIEAACKKTGRQAVILIDEYDKPVVDNLTRPELRDSFKETLQGFYSVLKGKDEFIRFGFLTGVTKMGKMSVFSGLNNLQDLSMNPEFTDICGISEDELKSCFGESVAELAEAGGLSVPECYGKLARMYDGYHFCPGSKGVYNPFSLLNTLKDKTFGEYWFATGTPTFLVNYLKESDCDLNDIVRNDVPLDVLNGTYTTDLKPVTLMYQAGYLTIKDYDPEFRTYNLGYPNEEVESGFLNSLSQIFTPSLNDGEFSVARFVRALRDGRIEEFMDMFTAFLSSNSYEVQGKLEIYFQNTISLMFKLMGFYVKTEYRTSDGRIDIVIQTDRFIYIIELKRDQSPDIALQQIERKGYDKPFLASGKRIVKLGINFSSETRTIDGWKMAE